VRAEDGGLEIRYAGRRRPFAVEWQELTAILLPRWPMGCWRIRRGGGSATLMPSDLLRNEDVLRIAIGRAALTFDGRGWRRPNSVDDCPPSKRLRHGQQHGVPARPDQAARFE
jgi:hypothetical protein